MNGAERGRAGRLAALVLVASSLGACAIAAPNRVGRATDERAARAGVALQREAFDAAREDLLALVADCRSGSRGRDALLLLAAAEIDTGNAERSPAMAAYLAESYLLLPDAAPDDLPIARALYRVGMDLSRPSGGVGSLDSLPPVAPRFERCDSGGPSTPIVRSLPTTPAPTAARLAALRVALSAHADSLVTARAGVAARSARIAALEAEIERIRELLTSGLDDYPRRRLP